MSTTAVAYWLFPSILLFFTTSPLARSVASEMTKGTVSTSLQVASCTVCTGRALVMHCLTTGRQRKCLCFGISFTILQLVIRQRDMVFANYDGETYFLYGSPPVPSLGSCWHAQEGHYTLYRLQGKTAEAVQHGYPSCNSGNLFGC